MKALTQRPKPQSTVFKPKGSTSGQEHDLENFFHIQMVTRCKFIPQGQHSSAAV